MECFDECLDALKEVIAICWTIKSQFGCESVKANAIRNLHELFELSLESGTERIGARYQGEEQMMM